MDRYLNINLTSEGLAFETAQIDFYISPLGLALIAGGFVIVKMIRRYKERN